MFRDSGKGKTEENLRKYNNVQLCAATATIKQTYCGAAVATITDEVNHKDLKRLSQHKVIPKMEAWMGEESSARKPEPRHSSTSSASPNRDQPRLTQTSRTTE